MTFQVFNYFKARNNPENNRGTSHRNKGYIGRKRVWITILSPVTMNVANSLNDTYQQNRSFSKCLTSHNIATPIFEINDFTMGGFNTHKCSLRSSAMAPVAVDSMQPPLHTYQFVSFCEEVLKFHVLREPFRRLAVT